jgi:hypothetical protein
MAAPAFAVPQTLTCTVTHALEWRAGATELRRPTPELDLGRHILHIAPQAGEWYLELTGSAALTIGGGRFTVLEPGFASRVDWVGIEGADVLRIRGDESPYPFTYVSGDFGAEFGACIEPAEPFLFLRKFVS